jgi:hypothetical protein
VWPEAGKPLAKISAAQIDCEIVMPFLVEPENGDWKQSQQRE